MDGCEQLFIHLINDGAIDLTLKHFILIDAFDTYITKMYEK